MSKTGLDSRSGGTHRAIDAHVTALSERESTQLRLLDFDDLFVLRQLLGGATIAATARSLGLTQPAITQRVRKLERVFGLQLLQKVGRHVRLTREGRRMCALAVRALELMQGLGGDVTRDDVRIACEARLARELVWPTLERMNRAAFAHDAEQAWVRKIQLRLSEALTNDAIYGASSEGAYDLVVCDARLRPATWAHAPVGELDYVCVASDIFSRSVSTPLELAGRRFLVTSPQDRSLAKLNEAFGNAVMSFHPWQLGMDELVLQACLAGLGFAVLPMHAVRAYLESGFLVSLNLPGELPPDRISASYQANGGGPDGEPDDDRLKAIIDELRSSLTLR